MWGARRILEAYVGRIHGTGGSGDRAKDRGLVGGERRRGGMDERAGQEKEGATRQLKVNRESERGGRRREWQ